MAEHSRVPQRVALRRLMAERMRGYVPLDSELEALFVALIQSWGFPRPVGQKEIRTVSIMGAYKSRIDFAWPELMLAIEMLGFIWHVSKHAFERDVAKRNVATVQGWKLLQFTWDDVMKRPGYVRECLEAVGLKPGTPSVGPGVCKSERS